MEKSKIYIAADTGDVHTIQQLASSGVDVTGIVNDRVSMCVAICDWACDNQPCEHKLHLVTYS